MTPNDYILKVSLQSVNWLLPYILPIDDVPKNLDTVSKNKLKDPLAITISVGY